MNLNVLVLRFTLASKGMKLPMLAGSVWHGGLGAVLHENSPKAFEGLYGAGGDESRLYSLLPPEGGVWPAGRLRQLQVSLFGPACQFALPVMQAVVRLGVVGLRPGGAFEVVAIERVALDRRDAAKMLFTARAGLLDTPAPEDLAAAWLAATAGFEQQQKVSLEMRMVSPLRIKEQNRELRSAPTCGQVLRRVLSRAEQLAHAGGLELPWLREGRAAWLSQAAEVGLTEADVVWHDMERRSARSRQTMSFGGLVGRVVYTQVPPPLAAWLTLAQSLQVGGKTAFGFGGVAVDVVALAPAGETGRAADGATSATGQWISTEETA